MKPQKIKLYLLSRVLQEDKKTSLQREIISKINKSRRKSLDNDTLEVYEHLVELSDKVSYRIPLSFPEIIFLSKYYRSHKNELSGKSVRYVLLYLIAFWV